MQSVEFKFGNIQVKINISIKVLNESVSPRPNSVAVCV